MPYQPRLSNPNDNTMVLNNIIIHTANKVELKKISEGGFTSIYMGEVPFWYTELSEKDKSFNKKEVMIPKKMLQKYFTIKL